MTEHDSEYRRQRLRELQKKQTSQADGDARDDKKDRLRRALAERQRGRMQDNSEDGQRPLERFPKLQEFLAKRRQSGEGGEQLRGGGRFKGRRRGGGAGRDGDAVLFARRIIDTDEPAGADEDIDGSLERLGKRADRLKTELFGTIEEMKQLKQKQKAAELKPDDEEDEEA